MPSQIKSANGNPAPIVTGVASIAGNTGGALTGALNLVGNSTNGWNVAGAGSTLTISHADARNFGATQNTAIGNVTGDGTLYTPAAFTTELYDNGAVFAASVFTANKTGLYRFSSTLWLLSIPPAATLLEIYITTDSYTMLAQQSAVYAAASANPAINAKAMIPVTSGETVRMQVAVTGGTLSVQYALSNPLIITHFEGALLT